MSEPAVCVPNASGTMKSATAAAEPLEDPPGVRDGSRGWPGCRGTVAALACAHLGHRVTLLEAEERVNDSPRASTTQPPTLEILAELGLIDEYIAQGLMAPIFQFWDRPSLRLIAEFDFDRLRGET